MLIVLVEFVSTDEGKGYISSVWGLLVCMRACACAARVSASRYRRPANLEKP